MRSEPRVGIGRLRGEAEVRVEPFAAGVGLRGTRVEIHAIQVVRRVEIFETTVLWQVSLRALGHLLLIIQTACEREDVTLLDRRIRCGDLPRLVRIPIEAELSALETCFQLALLAGREETGVRVAVREEGSQDGGW
jgi:hypothetical protein